jgi:hypothetical protein
MGLPKVERPLTIFNVAAPSAATQEMASDRPQRVPHPQQKETVNFR